MGEAPLWRAGFITLGGGFITPLKRGCCIYTAGLEWGGCGIMESVMMHLGSIEVPLFIVADLIIARCSRSTPPLLLSTHSPISVKQEQGRG